MPDFQYPHTYFLTNVLYVCAGVKLLSNRLTTSLWPSECRYFQTKRIYGNKNIFCKLWKIYLLVVMKSLSFPGHESECNVRCILLCVHPYVGPQLIYISKTWVYTIYDKIRREWEIKIITCCNNLLCKKQTKKTFHLSYNFSLPSYFCTLHSHISTQISWEEGIMGINCSSAYVQTIWMVAFRLQ